MITELLEDEQIKSEHSIKRKSNFTIYQIILILLTPISVLLAIYSSGYIFYASVILALFTLIELVYSEINVRRVKFYVTSKRLVKEKNFLGTKTKSIRYENIAHISPKAGYLDKKYGRGSINIKTPGTGSRDMKIAHIDNYESIASNISKKIDDTS